MDQMLMSPKNSNVEIRMPDEMVLVGKAFGWCLSLKGRTLMNGTSAV